MSTYFISDLHLDASRPEATQAFIDFLRGLSDDTDALYILGDLFESWIGDDDDAPLPAQVAQALRASADRGIRLFFMHGNRDFALGREYASRCGMTLLDDPMLIDLYGDATLLMHGDTLCTDDQAYQAFRSQVRNQTWLAHMLAQPLAVRRAFADQARAGSREHTATSAETIMDVNADAVADAFRQHGVDLLIHGHTHRPAVHRDDIDGRARTRIVLGDWYDQGIILRADADGRLHLTRLDDC
jgi:UDP-2,3-diacylglucosamine hydrolase